MKISEQQILPFGEENSISLPEGSHASHTVQQESERVKKMTATSGRKCLEQFGKFNQAGSWAKTFAALLIGMEGWYSTRCKLTWKLKATKCSRFYFQLQVSTLRTEGIEYGLLPTAQTQGLKVCEEGKTRFMNLDLLPTPRASENENRQTKLTPSQKTGKHGLSLAALAVEGLLPIPQCFDAEATFIKGKHYNGTNKHAEKLGQAIIRMGLLPTPQAAEGYIMTGGENQDSLTKLIGKSFQLNPLFVGEMMGYPSNWLIIPFLQNLEQESSEGNKHMADGDEKA